MRKNILNINYRLMEMDKEIIKIDLNEEANKIKELDIKNYNKSTMYLYKPGLKCEISIIYWQKTKTQQRKPGQKSHKNN